VVNVWFCVAMSSRQIYIYQIVHSVPYHKNNDQRQLHCYREAMRSPFIAHSFCTVWRRVYLTSSLCHTRVFGAFRFFRACHPWRISAGVLRRLSLLSLCVPCDWTVKTGFYFLSCPKCVLSADLWRAYFGQDTLWLATRISLQDTNTFGMTYYWHKFYIVIGLSHNRRIRVSGTRINKYFK